MIGKVSGKTIFVNLFNPYSNFLDNKKPIVYAIGNTKREEDYV
ncbi:MAG: hypothetical protein ACC630_02755 [Nitrospinota bacterium]